MCLFYCFVVRNVPGLRTGLAGDIAKDSFYEAASPIVLHHLTAGRLPSCSAWLLFALTAFIKEFD